MIGQVKKDNMLGTCCKCGHRTYRYGPPKEMTAPCEKCGNFIFKCLHLGFHTRKGFIPDHYVKVDLRTEHMLEGEYDPCKEEKIDLS